MNQELHELMLDQLKDAYSAEKQALKCLQKTARKATAAPLIEGIRAHIEQTQTQIERIEQCLEKAGGKSGRKVCEAMRGLVEEAEHEIEEQDEKGPLLDLVIVAGQQRIEHYEIAAYGTMVEIARAMKHEDIAGLLEQTLEEEKANDLKLTEITRSAILPQLLDEGGDEDDADEEEDDAPAKAKRAPARAKPAAKKG